MKPMTRAILGVLALLPFLGAALFHGTQAQNALPTPTKPTKVSLQPGENNAQAVFHHPIGFASAGTPRAGVDDQQQKSRLQVTIVDRGTGKPTFCRANVVGSDGHYYEPKTSLSPWSLHRLGNRAGKGPFRYFGWFFYCNGQFTVDVPAGTTRVEVWKGFEFRPVVHTLVCQPNQDAKVIVYLQRNPFLVQHGYVSGDTHLHLPRSTPNDDERALDLLAAEDIRYGFLLCMNDPRDYSGTMDRQLWPQRFGLGQNSARDRDGYTIASGQEYRCNTYGHICLLHAQRLALEGETVDPNQWPVFGHIGEETRRQGGWSFHAHGGYEREIQADVPAQTTDGVELLQFAEYRGIGLRGWYDVLNVGYVFPAVGASDYPYCRALGDCRTYVSCLPHASTTRFRSLDWIRAAAQGRGFFTTGPLLVLEVAGKTPGERIDVPGNAAPRVPVRLQAVCEVAPITHLELVVNGRVARALEVSASLAQGHTLEIAEDLLLTESAWIAGRVWSSRGPNQPDAEAHTNPVHVYRQGRAPYDPRALASLLARLETELAGQARRAPFPQQAAVLDYYRQARDRLVAIRQADGQPAPPRAP